MSVLVLFGHPALHKSQVNKHLLKVAQATEGVTVRNLYDLYPDFLIHVEAEQEALLAHDTIVMQHPFFWYSAPAIFKEYMDLVLEFDFAYGPNGNALKGKRWIQVISAGGSKPSYTPSGEKEMTVRQILRPFELTASLCGMQYLPPFVLYSSLTERVQETMPRVKLCYQSLLCRLQDRSDTLQELVTDCEIDAGQWALRMAP